MEISTQDSPLKALLNSPSPRPLTINPQLSIKVFFHITQLFIILIFYSTDSNSTTSMSHSSTHTYANRTTGSN